MFLFQIMPRLPWILSGVQLQTKLPLHNFLEKLTKRQQLRFDTFIPRGVDHAQSPMHQKRAIWKNKIFRTKQLSPSGKTQGESVLVKKNYVNCVLRLSLSKLSEYPNNSNLRRLRDDQDASAFGRFYLRKPPKQWCLLNIILFKFQISKISNEN